jgi:hypothetical protein
LNTALDKTFTASVDSSGQLTIAFTRGAANNPIVNAIQVAPVASGSLSFATGAQTLTAGQPSAAMQLAVSSAPQSSVSVGLSSSSSTGQFSTSASGPWSSTLTVSIPAGQTTSGNFFYQDSQAGSPVLTASASGFTSATQTETVNGNAQATTVRVNAGGGAYTDSSGNVWSADTGFSSGSLTYSNNVSIAGTSDPTLYQSQRWNRGPFSYTFTGLAAGSYQVTLKFAEIAGFKPGARQFNVAIQGTQVLTNFDVSAQVGLNTALDKTFTASVDSSGQLTIAFTRGAANNPIVNAIQVVPAS